MSEKQKNAEKTAVKVFEYEGKPVSFEPTGEEVMVNATEMAKPFGKRPNDWLNLPSTKEFLDEISTTRKSCSSDFQPVTTRNCSPQNGGGTWMHEDVALEFARWLSPKFAVWCNARIKELLRNGVTSLSTSFASRSDDEVVMDAMNILRNRLVSVQKVAAARRTQMDYCLNLCEERIAELTNIEQLPLNTFLPAEEPQFTLTQAAKHLRFASLSAFTSELQRLGFIYRDGNRWKPADKYNGTYFKIRHYYHGEKKNREDLGYAIVTRDGLDYFHRIFDPALFGSILTEAAEQRPAIEKGGEE